MEDSFFDRNRDLLKKVLGINDVVVEMLAFETERRSRYSFLLRHSFLFHGLLSVVSNLLYPLFGLKRKTRISNEDFIFVSCPDTFFRTRNIGLIAGTLKYHIIYLPNFHISSALKYHSFFKKEGIAAFFPTIKLKDILVAKKKFNALRKEIGEVSEVNNQKALMVIANFLIQDNVAKEFVNNAASFKGKWILEHDKFYFMPTVVNLHKQGNTCTMLQHGCFVEIDKDFMPLFCDKVLCCSERERQTYISYGVKPENVIAFGAPLQAIGDRQKTGISKGKRYKLLVLLTLVNDESFAPMQSVLRFVQQNYDSVLIRMRPRSKKNDMKLFHEELKGFEISTNKNTLAEDISACDKVISFSEDANLEVAKLNKPFVYIHSWMGKERQLRHDLPYATSENYKEEIHKLMEQDFYSSFNKEQYREILGETDINVLREKFSNYILS